MPAGSFALPAWATKAAGVFSEFAPLSWVMADFVGRFVYALSEFVYGTGQQRSVRSRYDARFLQETGGVDPLAKVLEAKHICLNDFILSSNPMVDGKNFVKYEIDGPENIILADDNSINGVRPGPVDAVAISGERTFYN